VSLQLAADETRNAVEWVTGLVNTLGRQQTILYRHYPYEGPKSVVSFTRVDPLGSVLVRGLQKKIF